MKKNISKKLIIATTLELIKDKSDIRTMNLRAIARVLGCAHTNLYNYFPSFQDLLWEAHMEIENIFIKQITLLLGSTQDHEVKLHQFYFFLAEFYLDHKGWFRLAWLDPIDNMQPEEDKIVTEKAVNTMIELLEDIWLNVYLYVPGKERIHGLFHDVHCYIVGEVSNFINGRGFIQDKELLKQHIAKTSVAFFTLSLREEHGI